MELNWYLSCLYINMMFLRVMLIFLLAISAFAEGTDCLGGKNEEVSGELLSLLKDTKNIALEFDLGFKVVSKTDSLLEDIKEKEKSIHFDPVPMPLKSSTFDFFKQSKEELVQHEKELSVFKECEEINTVTNPICREYFETINSIAKKNKKDEKIWKDISLGNYEFELDDNQKLDISVRSSGEFFASYEIKF
jgi:hypothetical protein